MCYLFVRKCTIFCSLIQKKPLFICMFGIK